MKTFIALLAVAAIAVPAVSAAATYQYVSVSGEVKTIEAANADIALTASDIARTSGVLLIDTSADVIPEDILMNQ